MSKNRSNAVRKDEVAAPATNEAVSTNPNPEAPATETQAPATTETPKVEEPKVEGLLAKSAEDLIKEFGNKSNAIRAMAAAGHKAGPISKALGIRYQHARNVLNQPLKRVIKDEREAAKKVEAAASTETK